MCVCGGGGGGGVWVCLLHLKIKIQTIINLISSWLYSDSLIRSISVGCKNNPENCTSSLYLEKKILIFWSGM